jgi:hypothetical protein
LKSTPIALGLGHELVKQLKSLRQDRSLDNANAGDIASRSVDAGDKTGLHRIAAATFKDNRNCRSRCLSRPDWPITARGEDYGDRAADQVRRESG